MFVPTSVYLLSLIPWQKKNVQSMFWGKCQYLPCKCMHMPQLSNIRTHMPNFKYEFCHWLCWMKLCKVLKQWHKSLLIKYSLCFDDQSTVTNLKRCKQMPTFEEIIIWLWTCSERGKKPICFFWIFLCAGHCAGCNKKKSKRNRKLKKC